MGCNMAMTIKWKLTVGFGVLLLLLVIFGIIVLVEMVGVQKHFQLVVEHHTPVIINANRLLTLVVDMETGQKGFAITQKEEFLEPYNYANEGFSKLLEIEKELVSDDPSQTAILDKIENLVEQWHQKAAAPEIAKAREIATGKDVNKQYKALRELAALLEMGTEKALIDEIREEFAELIKVEEQHTKQQYAAASQTTLHVRKTVILLVVFSIILGSTMAVLIIRAMVSSVGRLLEGTEIIGAGDLKHRIKVKSKDEIGQLTLSFNRMAEKLQQAECQILHDITERKKIEGKLIENERSLAMAQQVACVGSWDWDILNDKLTWSNETYRQLGLKPNEIEPTYEAFARYVHPDDLDRVNEAVKAAIEEDTPYSIDAWMIRKDGTEWIMHAQGMVQRNDDGKAVRFVGTQQDITERKRVESNLENYKEKVLKAQKHAYIDSMAAIVAHQVNQPLTKINILLDRAIEQIEEASCSPTVLKNVKEGLAEAQKAASIIRKFRQHSKGPALEDIGKVNVISVADRIVSVLSEKTRQAKMLISVQDVGDLPEVETNEIALEQIFLVIIQNAIDAADGQKSHKFEINGKFVDGNIELRLADDCGGIAAENLDKIFEPFFSTKGQDKGMGLGLDIVQQILISLGGQIRVESQPGKGTTFYITLPISNSHGVKK